KNRSGHVPGIAALLMMVIWFAGGGLALWLGLQGAAWAAVILGGLAFIGGLYVLLGLKLADQWEKAVVLRFGRLIGQRGPGLFWIVPVADQVTQWIDQRVIVAPFSAEKTLTKDTVPVNVDAVMFWLVWDAEKAALEVEDYRAAISWAAQTALREVIGASDLADILV